MRSFSVLLTLGLVSVMAAPAPIAAPEPAPATPFLSAKDPMALHRRSIPQIAHSVLDVLASSASRLSSQITTLMPSTSAPVEDDEAEKLAAEAEYYGTYGSYEAEIQAWEDRHVQCAEICKVRTIEGARSGEEALCSADGLESTLACAQCIDTTWPEDMYENSAMSEYARIALSCEAPSTLAA